MKLQVRTTMGAVLLGAAVAACGGGGGGGGDDEPGTPDAGIDANIDEWDQRLEEREYNYSAALRIAALRLTGELPTLAQINQVANAGDATAQKAAYEGLVQQFLAAPEFARQMYLWWQDTLKLGADPEYASAAAFAAKLSVDNASYMQLFTATTGQCGSYDMGSGTFTPADCTNGAVQAGLLTHPGMLRQFFGNLAFRRVRWVQETFACTKFPAEISATPEPLPTGLLYTGLFPFADMPDGTTNGRINFADASAVVCANCHSTMNHIAPLFAFHDEDGQLQGSPAVPTPLEGSPVTELTDYLVGAQDYAWRLGLAAPDLPALGQVLATDPYVAECAVARAWNWAMGKTDIVDTLQTVPTTTIQQQIDDFTADGFKIKDLLFNVFTADDFVKF